MVEGAQLGGAPGVLARPGAPPPPWPARRGLLGPATPPTLPPAPHGDGGARRGPIACGRGRRPGAGHPPGAGRDRRGLRPARGGDGRHRPPGPGRAQAPRAPHRGGRDQFAAAPPARSGRLARRLRPARRGGPAHGWSRSPCARRHGARGDDPAAPLLAAAVDAVARRGGGRLRYWTARAGTADDARAGALGFAPERDLLQLRVALPLDKGVRRRLAALGARLRARARRGGVAGRQQPGLRRPSRAGRLGPGAPWPSARPSPGSTRPASSSTRRTAGWPARAGPRSTPTPCPPWGRSTSSRSTPTSTSAGWAGP